MFSLLRGTPLRSYNWDILFRAILIWVGSTFHDVTPKKARYRFLFLLYLNVFFLLSIPRIKNTNIYRSGANDEEIFTMFGPRAAGSPFLLKHCYVQFSVPVCSNKRIRNYDNIIKRKGGKGPTGIGTGAQDRSVIGINNEPPAFDGLRSGHSPATTFEEEKGGAVYMCPNGIKVIYLYPFSYKIFPSNFHW